MLIEHEGRSPTIVPTAYVAPSAVVCGDIVVGPHAHVNGAIVEDDCFLATGCSLFPGSRVGAGSEVRIGAVVQVNTVLAPGTTVPIHWVATGDPAQLFSPDRHDEIWAVQEPLDFPRTVFGIPREELTMERATSAYATLFGSHADDRLLDG